MKNKYKLLFMTSVNLFEMQSSDDVFTSLGDIFKKHIGSIVGVTSF